MSASNYPLSLPLLIFEKKFRLTFKNFKKFRISLDFSMGILKRILAPFIWTFIHELGLRPNSILDQAKF